MASYVVPQVEIHQLFSEIPVALAQNQVPFVFGPNYLLHRYGAADEREGTYVGEYSSLVQPGFDETLITTKSNDTVVAKAAGDAVSDDTRKPYFYPYPGALDVDSIDKSYTKVFADKCVVALSVQRDVDRVYGNDGSDSDSSPDVKPDVLDINIDDPRLAFEITTGRKLRVYCMRGEYDVGSSDSSPEDPTDYAYIADVTIVDVDPEHSSSSKIRVTIDEELDDDLSVYKAVLCEVQDNVEITRHDYSSPNKESSSDNWVEDVQTSVSGAVEYGIKIRKQFCVKVRDQDFVAMNVEYGEVLSAEMYVQFRELLTTASDTIHTLTYASEVMNALGAVSPDNPLAQAVYNAALNSGGQIVRYMAVPTDDLDGYSKVLNAATLTKEVYFLVPVTRDSKVLDLVQSHVNDMSAPTSKRWRIAFVSAEIPETAPVYVTADGHDFMAKVTLVNHASADPDQKFAEVQYVVKVGESWVADSDTRFKKDLKVNDVLLLKFDNIEWGKSVPQEYRITKILSNNKVRVSDPNGELEVTTAGEKSEIYHPYTNAEKAEVIRDLSSNFGDRRIYNVFPSQFYGGGVLQTGEFAAACVAGLVASCLPQQPVTNLELVGIDDVPLTYQTFSYYELNTIASGGTFIVMQDLPNDQVYIRHQISTAYEDNNLNTAELSITKNLDSISFFFDNLLSPYIGKYNITPDLLEVIRNVIVGGLTSLENTAWGLYGPQVVAEGTEILLLEQDAVLKDHVNCNLKLNLPYPFNHLVLKLFV